MLHCCGTMEQWLVVWWCSGVLLLNFIQQSLTSSSAQVQILLDRDSRWSVSLTMVPAGNKAKCLSSDSHTTKTIHRHQHFRLGNTSFTTGQSQPINTQMISHHILQSILFQFFKKTFCFIIFTCSFPIISENCRLLYLDLHCINFVP